MEHRPPELVNEVKDVFRVLHGGSFTILDAPFQDDHGDGVVAASPIAVSEVVDGVLDKFDFDYFRFQAEEGQKYRLTVDYETLPPSSVTL